MKLTNQEIITMLYSLQSLSEKDFPISITYTIINNVENLLRAHETYSKTLEKAKTEEEISELLSIETKVDIKTIDKQALIDSGISISPVTLVGLKRLIDD